MSNLNYFLISCSWPYYEKVAESLEKTINSSPAVWTAHPSRLEELTRKFPNTKVLNAHDLTCADLSVVEDAIYPAPLSIDSLSPSWQEKYSFERAMVMDNLLHRSDFGGRYSHAELLDIVNDYFIAADSLIKKFSPKLIYFEVPPHTMYDLAIYYLALSNNIKTLMVYDTCVPAVSVFLTKFNDANGIYQLSKLQQSRYEEKKNLFSTYCENIKNTNPFYMSSVVEWNGLKRTKEAIKLAIITIRHIIKERIQKLIRDKLNNRVGGNLKRAGYSKKRGVLLKDETASQLDILKEYFINWNLESIYKKASHDFNINKIVDNENYVYIPLSMQIEMTTMPSAGRMFDQKAYIRMVCSALPNGWIPIVKENPKQFTNLTGAPSRDKRFYSLPAAFLVNFLAVFFFASSAFFASASAFSFAAFSAAAFFAAASFAAFSASSLACSACCASAAILANLNLFLRFIINSPLSEMYLNK